MALCYAATSYLSGGTQFHTYAVAVIRNHLMDYCQRIVAQCRNMPICSLDTSHGEDRPPPIKESKIARDDTEKWVSRIYLSQLLEHGKRHYKGVAKLGIEAMELKIKGYSGVDIARLYHTKPTHVGAWISRASEKLRKDAMNAELIPAENFENTA